MDGQLCPTLLENLSGIELTEALGAYVRRAKHGSEDAALVVGTSKDLLEATAAHVLQTMYGSYPSQSNFPTLLGQAFAALNLKTSQHQMAQGEPALCRLERALFDVGCAVNALRNKQGTGHGRPWLPEVNDAQAKIAIQSIGTVAELLLLALKKSYFV